MNIIKKEGKPYPQFYPNKAVCDRQLQRSYISKIKPKVSATIDRFDPSLVTFGLGMQSNNTDDVFKLIETFIQELELWADNKPLLERRAPELSFDTDGSCTISARYGKLEKGSK